MLSTENQFYKNLLLMNMGALFLSVLPGFSQYNFLSVDLLLVFCFFLLSQFYFGNFRLRLFSLAILLNQLMFIGNAMRAMKSVTVQVYGEEHDSYGFLFGLVFLVPVVYLLFNTKIWYKEINSASSVNIDERQKYMEFVPLGLTVVFLVFNLVSGGSADTESGIQSLSPNPFLLNGSMRILKENIFSNKTLIMVPVIAVLYFGRRNILLGVSVLALYVLQIVVYGIELLLKRNLLSDDAGFSYPTYTGGELAVKFVLPIAALVIYWMYFNKDSFLRINFQLLREPQPVMEEDRPMISIEDFKLKNQKLLQNESLLLSIGQFFFGLYLVILACSKNETMYFILLFGGMSVFGSVLYYLGVRSWNNGLSVLGYILQTSVPVLIFLISAFDHTILGRLSNGTVISTFFISIVLLVWGIPILRALANPDHFINFVQNRDNSRIHNEKPGFQMSKFDGNQSAIDLYSNELIPWKQRKLATLLFLGLQGLGFIGFTDIIIVWSYDFPGNGSWVRLWTISEVIIILMFYVAILKWGMFQNRIYCILMFITYLLTSLLIVIQLINESQVNTLQGVLLMINLGIVIYFGYMIVHLVRRKQNNAHPAFRQNPDILD